MTRSTLEPLRLLCWEGYDTPALLDTFKRRHGIEVYAKTLLSDAATAIELANGDHGQWDVININNAYVRDYLHPRGLIQPLDESFFGDFSNSTLAPFERQKTWTRDTDGALIGVCQRFGPFNLVVNSARIDVCSAEDQGFALAADLAYRRRFGILEYEDFNLFHLCIACSLNPFQVLSAEQESDVEEMARSWYESALLASDDHHVLNKALIDGEIDFYLSGGVYTVSPARLAGHTNLCAITPRSGPIDGRGGIVFTEITSALARPDASPLAPMFLNYLLEPETAIRAAFVQGTCNPVAQMGQPQVFNAFSADQLKAIQWDSLLEDVSRCADYQIMPNHDSLLTRLRGVRAHARSLGKFS